MRYEYIHNLRGFAIFLVVLTHAIFVLPSPESFIYFRYFLINSTLLFMVIGGFLFSEIVTRYTYKKYLLSKIKNILLPYMLISIPAVLVYILKIKTTHLWVDMDAFYQYNVMFQYLYLMLTGAHLGPLWFIPMIIVFYLLFPVFKWVNKQSSFYSLFFITLIVGIYLGRPMLNSNVFESFLYFLPAYLFGMWLHKNQQIICKLKDTSVVILSALIIICLICYHFFDYNSQYDLVLKLFISFSLFCLFAKYSLKENALLNYLAQFSFFLFFIHGYFVGIVRSVIQKAYFFENIYLVMFSSLVFILLLLFILCYLVFFFIPINKRYILGAR